MLPFRFPLSFLYFLLLIRVLLFLRSFFVLVVNASCFSFSSFSPSSLLLRLSLSHPFAFHSSLLFLSTLSTLLYFSILHSSHSFPQFPPVPLPHPLSIHSHSCLSFSSFRIPSRTSSFLYVYSLLP